MRVWAVLVAAVVLLGAVAFASAESADAESDPTGVWDLTFVVTDSLPCPGSIVVQSAGTLSIGLSCIAVSLSGTFDKASGLFDATGDVQCKGLVVVPFTMSGVVLGSGSSMSGTWSVSCIGQTNGTFSGFRTGPLPPTATPTDTATATASATATATATATETPTDTPTPSPTYSATPISTATPTRTATATDVSGVSPDASVGALPAAGARARGSGGSTLEIAIASVAAAVALGLGGAAWYARRRVRR